MHDIAFTLSSVAQVQWTSLSSHTRIQREPPAHLHDIRAPMSSMARHTPPVHLTNHSTPSVHLTNHPMPPVHQTKTHSPMTHMPNNNDVLSYKCARLIKRTFHFLVANLLVLGLVAARPVLFVEPIYAIGPGTTDTKHGTLRKHVHDTSSTMVVQRAQ